MEGFGPVVDTEWLAAHADAVVIADVRWYLDGRSGREAYDRGHIGGARFVDLDTDLSGPPTTGSGRHPLPAPEDFAAAMGRLGIGDDTAVVAYDDAGGVMASRLWWMLDALDCAAAVLDGGIDAWTAAVLDGGIDAWTAAVVDGGIDAWTGALSTEAPSWPAANFTARPWPSDRLATIDEVDAARSDPSHVVIDARSVERYRGEPNAIDPRFGHIPGAVSMQVGDNLRDGRLRPASELRARYAEAGAEDRQVIAYCGSGVSACHDLLAIRHAGLDDGRLFVGSWSAWGSDPDRPLATA